MTLKVGDRDHCCHCGWPIRVHRDQWVHNHSNDTRCYPVGNFYAEPKRSQYA